MDFEKEIEKIKERNKKVQADKAWETSNARRITIVILTYAAIVVFLIQIRDPNPFFNALIPAAAFSISTLSLPFLKKIWLKHFYKK